MLDSTRLMFLIPRFNFSLRCLACLFAQIFQSNFHPRVRVELRLEAKVNAAKLVQALFEARQDLSVHKLLAKELEPAMLEMVRNYVTAVLKKTEAEGDADDDGDQEKYQEVQ